MHRVLAAVPEEICAEFEVPVVTAAPDRHFLGFPRLRLEVLAGTSDFEKDYVPASVMNFASALLSWDAAANGLGIAMGQTKMLEEEITAGKLITPFHFPVNIEKYYFVFLPAKGEKSGAVLFKDWLMAQFAGTPASSGGGRSADQVQRCTR